MSRASKAAKRTDLIDSYVREFKRKLELDLSFDIRGRIDRERDALKRGAMLCAERQVYAEMRKIERVR